MAGKQKLFSVNVERFATANKQHTLEALASAQQFLKIRPEDLLHIMQVLLQTGGSKNGILDEQGFEPWTSRMQSGRSTTELHAPMFQKVTILNEYCSLKLKTPRLQPPQQGTRASISSTAF